MRVQEVYQGMLPSTFSDLDLYNRRPSTGFTDAPTVNAERERMRLLSEVSESIASHRDLNELFRDLAQRLPQIVPFDYINLVLHEPARDVMRLWLLVTATPSTISPGLELSIDESPGGLVWKTQQPLTVNDITQEQ